MAKKPSRGAGLQAGRTLRDPFVRYGGLGIQFAATIAVFALGGAWLDRKLGTFPLLLVAGVFLGFAGGLVSLVKKVPPARGAASSRDATDDSRTPS